MTQAPCSLGHPVSGVLSSPSVLLPQTSPNPAGVQGHTRGEGNLGGPSLREETWPKGPQWVGKKGLGGASRGGECSEERAGEGGVLFKNRALVISSYTIWGDPGATGMVLG